MSVSSLLLGFLGEGEDTDCLSLGGHWKRGEGEEVQASGSRTEIDLGVLEGTLKAELRVSLLFYTRTPLTKRLRYNSHVLHLIEGFAHLTEDLRDAEHMLSELKKLRVMELNQFRSISEEWMQKEDAYKAEIKRLELILAKESKDGVACVALARQNSVINRSESKDFQERVKRLSNPRKQGMPRISASLWIVARHQRGVS